MAGVFFDQYVDKILDEILGAVELTNTRWDVGLSLTEPASDGSNITEPTVGAYARVQTTRGDTGMWPAASARQKTNGASITFPTATAAWGDPLTWVIFDESGLALGYGDLSQHGVIAAGITASFAPGTLTIGLPAS